LAALTTEQTLDDETLVNLACRSRENTQ
jgi:hypothetical protein